jgi:hypothetical protein
MGLIRICLFLSIVISNHSYAIDSTQYSIQKGSSQMNVFSLFAKPEVLCKIPLTNNILTYKPCDMGPESAIWPEPIFFIPHVGLIAFDCGKDLSLRNLHFFTAQGVFRFTIDLIKLLKLENPSEFNLFAFEYDTNGVFTFLSSKQHNSKIDNSPNYLLVTLNNRGELLNVKNAPDDLQNYEGFTLLPGTFICLRRNVAGQLFWYQFRNDNFEQVFTEGIAGRYATFCGKTLLILQNDSSWTVIDDFNKKQVIKLREFDNKETNKTHLSTIAGFGNYFGLIQWYKSERVTNSPPTFHSQRVLNVFYLNKENNAVFHLGQVNLRNNMSILLRETAALHNKPIPLDDIFELYQIAHGPSEVPPSEACFDEKGNYYEVAKTPTELIVYCYKIDEKEAEKIIGAAVGKAKR